MSIIPSWPVGQQMYGHTKLSPEIRCGAETSKASLGHSFVSLCCDTLEQVLSFSCVWVSWLAMEKVFPGRPQFTCSGSPLSMLHLCELKGSLLPTVSLPNYGQHAWPLSLVSGSQIPGGGKVRLRSLSCQVWKRQIPRILFGSWWDCQSQFIRPAPSGRAWIHQHWHPCGYSGDGERTAGHEGFRPFLHSNMWKWGVMFARPMVITLIPFKGIMWSEFSVHKFASPIKHRNRADLSTDVVRKCVGVKVNERTQVHNVRSRGF